MLAWVNRALGAGARWADNRSTAAFCLVVACGVLAVIVINLMLGAFLLSNFNPNVVRLDGLSPWFEDTVYSDGYTHSGFLRVRVGDDPQAVRTAVGEPLVRQFWYGTRIIAFRRTAQRWEFHSNDGSVSPGDFDHIRAAYGEPERETWNYTLKGPADTNWRVRYLVFKGGKVVEKHAEYEWD